MQRKGRRSCTIRLRQDQQQRQQQLRQHSCACVCVEGAARKQEDCCTFLRETLQEASSSSSGGSRQQATGCSCSGSCFPSLLSPAPLSIPFAIRQIRHWLTHTLTLAHSHTLSRARISLTDRWAASRRRRFPLILRPVTSVRDRAARETDSDQPIRSRLFSSLLSLLTQSFSRSDSLSLSLVDTRAQ